MNTYNNSLIEPLSADETALLRQIYERELLKMRVVLWKIYKIISIIFIVIILFVSIAYLFTPEEDLIINDEKISLLNIIINLFVGAAICTAVLTIVFGIAYWVNVRPIFKDLKSGIKIIEIVTVLQKQYMPHTNAYYFTINSKYKLALEVDKHYYEHYREGDEINLEYTKYANIDLGYH